MFKNKRPSGAEFRKRKKEDEEQAKKHPKILSFFKVEAGSSSTATATISSDDTITDCDKSEHEQLLSPELVSVEQEINDMAVAGSSQVSECDNNCLEFDNEECNPKSETGSDVHQLIDDRNKICITDTGNFDIINTDIGLYCENDLLQDDFKMSVLNAKPCKPQGPFPKEAATNRSFNSDYYYSKTKTGQKIDRFWLCYSPLLNGVYCEPCWLFADRLDPHYNNAWCKGTINDWQGLSKKIKEHEMSKVHLNACVTYSIRKNRKVVQCILQEDVAKWREILKRILDVIITMSTCNLAFRGHREYTRNIDSKSGNFLNIIDLISRYDPLLKSHLENEKCRTKYMSASIQNELISLASQHVLRDIISEIQEAPFFSLILDTTQDISKTDQLSVVIRYVCINHDEKKLQINESFLGFISITNQKAEGLESEVCKFLESNNISIKKCRGQGYDGAAVMSGKYIGLQTKIKRKSPNAEYVHCANHNLNLVLNDSVKEITEMIVFYDVINEIYVYFSQSLPRWQSLKEISSETCMVNKTIKRLCPTRWSSRFDCLLAVKVNFIYILNCLSKIILTSTKRSEEVEATALRRQMSTFHFILMLVFQSKILESINITSKTLQKSGISLDEASTLLERSVTKLNELRGQFDKLVEEAKEIARSWQIETSLPTKRKHKVTSFFDELSKDVEFTDPLHNFRVKVFYRAIDLLIGQVNRRYQSMRMVTQMFCFLSPTALTEQTDKELMESADKFYKKYEADVTRSLVTEIVCFRNVVESEIKKRKMTKIIQVAEFLLIENKMLSCSIPDVCTAFIMFLTLPVTSSSAERSFSKLKVIKSYLRSTMTSVRLSGLALLSIEYDRARALDLENLVQTFCDAKRRRGLMSI